MTGVVPAKHQAVSQRELQRASMWSVGPKRRCAGEDPGKAGRGGQTGSDQAVMAGMAVPKTVARRSW